MLATLCLWACTDDAEPMASARIITSTDDLIGGNAAVGDLGDFLLENQHIRAIVQGPGFSRVAGVFGGALIDIDRRRASEGGDSGAPSGHDAFGELFPSFFTQAVAVDNVNILSNGSDGGRAAISVSGFGGDTFSFLGVLNRAGVGSHEDYLDPDSEPTIRYETVYELEPDGDYVTMRFRVTNISDEVLELPGEDARTLLGLVGLNLAGFTIPVGDIALFGATSPVFAPGAGFGSRFALRDAYADESIDFPAFRGLVTDWFATRGDDVSYGLFIDETDANYVFNKSDIYDDGMTPITRSSMMLFLEASGFFGIFSFDAPAQLAAGETWEVVKYLAVGTGDVGSVLDVMHEVRGTTVGRFGGEVTDEVSGQPALDAAVFVYQRRPDGTHRIYSQYDVFAGGHFGGTLEPGDYSLRVSGPGRPVSDFVDFSIAAGQTKGVRVSARSPGRIAVTVRDRDGFRLPARVTAVGTYGPEHSGELTRDFLFDVEVGQHFRYSDMTPDSADDPLTRRYIEAFAPTVDGTADLLVRPGTYEVLASRGPEYDLQSSVVTVGPGETVSVMGTLSRVVDTSGWISADLHIHTINSVDAAVELSDRIGWLAGEGIEWAVATDHNYITDFGPTIAQLGLNDWMVSTVGIELTTLDGGHFNGYPLRYEIGPTTHGSFEWSMRPPQEIFDAIRDLGAYGREETIVQVCHPRDSVLGYFNQHRRNALTTEFDEPDFIERFLAEAGPAFYDESGQSTFSLDFDVLEVFNGGRMELLHHYRVPETLPEGEIPPDVPPAGTILLDSDGEVAYPGGVDDWYNYLNLGERFIAVGASDVHHDGEPSGYARSMIYVGSDDPRGLHERDIVRAMRERRVIATNGPMVDFYVNDPVNGAMGSTLTDADGTISLTLTLSGPPWMAVSRVNIVRNGLIAHVISVDENRDLSANPVHETVELSLEPDEEGNSRDSWFVVEAIGYHNLFPVVWPYEVPPIVVGDAIGSLAEPLGFGGEFGDLKPATAFPITAYAITNPVWVTLDGDFTPPGTIPSVVRRSADNDEGMNQNPFGYSALRMPPEAETDLPAQYRPVGTATPIRPREIPLFARDPANPYDIRRIFAGFDHGH